MIAEIIGAMSMQNHVVIGLDMFNSALMILEWSMVLQQLKNVLAIQQRNLEYTSKRKKKVVWKLSILSMVCCALHPAHYAVEGTAKERGWIDASGAQVLEIGAQIAGELGRANWDAYCCHHVNARIIRD
ncbi:MAG TPA: hypothetical protein VKM55_06325 [Candidatus Lokiarchaeia archaeon]|nr:hypothetical protein [Candidatus Lokiarchaeia archaeon]